MLRYIHTILWGVICSCSYAQCPETNPNCNAANNWVLGDSCGIYMDQDTTYYYQTALNANEGTAVLSDKNGDLLFYTDGIEVYNKNHRKLAIDLKAYFSSTQTSLINRFDSTIYITTTHPDSGYYIGKFDMSGDSLLLVNNHKKNQRCAEGQAAVNHQNGNSIWVVSTNLFSDTIFFFHLTKSRILCCPVGVKFKNQTDEVMTLKFTQTARLFGISSNWGQYLSLSNFDCESANIFNETVISNSQPFSFEFSPNEQYISVNSKGQTISTLDIRSFNKTSIENSQKILFTSLPRVTFGAIGLNKINEFLFAQYDSSYIGKINQIGDSFDWTKEGYYLGEGRNSYFGTPNFNASYFYTPAIDFAYTEDCWGHTYSFEGRDTFDADGYKWLFEKGSYRDSILTKHSDYTFPDTGKWEVSHIAWNTTRADTVTKTLTIRPKWREDVLGRDTFYCIGEAVNIVLQAPADMHCVHWNGEEPNLDESLGPIIDYDHFHTDSLIVDTAGTYIVKLTNKTFCQMYDTILVEEKPRPSKSVMTRVDNLLTSSFTAAEYRWYYNGKPKFQHTNSTINPDSNGYWQVQLVSEFGCESELSDSLLVGFASVEDLGRKTNDLGFVVYPNPSDGNLSVEVPKSGLYHIQVTDFTGKQIYCTNQNLFASANELDFEFSSGSYILTITDENGNIGSKKVEVVR